VKSRVLPDSEVVVRDALAGVLGSGVRVATELTADLETYPRFVHVERVGGPRFRFHDEPLLYVSSFAPTRVDASNLARNVDDAVMNALANTVVSGGRMQDVGCRVRPRFVPYENPLLWRYLGIYALAVCPG
jgi:hypothetical protein